MIPTLVIARSEATKQSSVRIASLRSQPTPIGPHPMILSLFNDRDAHLGGKIVGIYAVLVVANVLAWLWALIAFHDYPVLIGTAFLAYTFGLRHAVDADHIAAIDNVTRKLMQEGKRPVAVGFFFSLGHSTIVVACVRRDCAGDRRPRRPL